MAAHLPPQTSLGTATLRVAGLDRANQFYTQVVGFDAEAGPDGTRLLAHGRHVLTLVEHPGIPAKPRAAAGLFHVAILLPDRAALGAALRHLARRGIRLGASDHIVSEALYLEDPDGNGLEIYADRPPDTWRWSDGEIAMATEPLDTDDLIAAAGPDEAPYRMPGGTAIGHVHLQVGDLGEAKRFYSGILGFDVTTERYPGALFMSAGGYHHHVAVNVWRSRGSRQAPAGTAGLDAFEVLVPPQHLDVIRQRLETAGAPLADTGGGIETRDPWDNRIRIRGQDIASDGLTG